MHPPSPTVRLRQLSLELVRLRQEAGLKLGEAAAAAGWAQSKLSRAETRQWRQPDPSALGRLLDVYGVTQQDRPDKRLELLQLAREARRRGWWQDYKLTAEYSTYVGLESEAKLLRNWEPELVPGLLQSPAYARAVIAARAPELDSAQVDDLVALRVERQERLLQADAPINVWAIVSEHALRATVGGHAVMAEQLEHLHKVSGLPNVILQMHPFEAGVAPARGPFAVLTFPEPTDPEAVYLETPGGDLWVEEPQAIAKIIRDWERLIPSSLPAPDTLSVIEARANYLRTRGGRRERTTDLA